MKRAISIPTRMAVIAAALTMGAVQSMAFNQSEYPPAGVIPIIFDTDMGPDIDDVGALAVLHAFADIGACKIIAIGVNTPEPYGCCCADAINTYYKRPDIPIGIVKNGPGVPSSQNYSKPITEQFPNDLKNSMSTIPDAVVVYRQVLSRQADSSVVFVATGFTTILSQLLNSPADTISPLAGKELVRKKVRLLSDMGGQYPGGNEFNLIWDGLAAQNVATNWPTPIVF
jgi:pyrimidine-specific ribonucleoside hydrolase